MREENTTHFNLLDLEDQGPCTTVRVGMGLLTRAKADLNCTQPVLPLLPLSRLGTNTMNWYPGFAPDLLCLKRGGKTHPGQRPS